MSKSNIYFCDPLTDEYWLQPNGLVPKKDNSSLWLTPDTTNIYLKLNFTMLFITEFNIIWYYEMIYLMI